jgi:L-asparaginase
VGTDTLEETAFLLDLLYTGNAPVVVTGAMPARCLPERTDPRTSLLRFRSQRVPCGAGSGALLCSPIRCTRPGGRVRRLGLVTIVFGDDGELLRAAADRFDGLVIAAFGVGNVPARLVLAVEELAERLPVVVASRTGAGSNQPARRRACRSPRPLTSAHRGWPGRVP